MDLLFTKRELSWLDDLMPESKKKKLEDAEKEVSQSKTSIFIEKRKRSPYLVIVLCETKLLCLSSDSDY